MLTLQPSYLRWLEPVKSLSPIDLASDVDTSVHVWLMAGSEDPVVPPILTQEYAAALQAHGVHVDVTVVPGLKHNILLEPVIFGPLKKLVETVQTPRSN